MHVLASLFIPVGVLAGPYFTENVRSDTSPDSPVCLFESCILTAGDLLRQMDRNVDPCQDFYKFACGGFISDTVVPEDKTETGSPFNTHLFSIVLKWFKVPTALLLKN